MNYISGGAVAKADRAAAGWPTAGFALPWRALDFGGFDVRLAGPLRPEVELLRYMKWYCEREAD